MSTQSNAASDISKPQLGQQVHGPFVIARLETKESRNGKQYWNVELRNETGSISSRVWQERFEIWEGAEPGSPVMITGRVENGFPEGTLELSVQRVEVLEAPHPVQHYLNPVYPGDIEELKAEFQALRSAIKHPGYRIFFDRFFETVCPLDRFFTCPAARGMHHAYIGGLLEHSVEVTRLWLAFAEQQSIQNLVSKDLGIVGSMIHDAGKIHEYVWEGVPIDMSPDALLYGHMTMGPLMVQAVMERHRDELREAGFTQQDAKFLIHMIVSHHGTNEWGSPTRPAMIESVLLHQADLMSARVRGIAQLVSQNQPDRHGKIEAPGRSDYRFGVIAGPAVRGSHHASVEEPLERGAASPDSSSVQVDGSPLAQPAFSFAQSLGETQAPLSEDEADRVLANLPGLFDRPDTQQEPGALQKRSSPSTRRR